MDTVFDIHACTTKIYRHKNIYRFESRFLKTISASKSYYDDLTASNFQQLPTIKKIDIWKCTGKTFNSVQIIYSPTNNVLAVFLKIDYRTTGIPCITSQAENTFVTLHHLEI